MSKKENQIVQKTRIDYMQATSLRELLDNVNTHNKEYPENAILKEDIVRILKEEGTFIMLYYRLCSLYIIMYNHLIKYKYGRTKEYK